MEQALAKKLDEIDWDNLLPRLLLYSTSLIRRYGLQESTSPEDLTYKAVSDLLSGRIKWSEQSSLLSLLAIVVKHEAIKLKRREPERISIDEELLLYPERASQGVEYKELSERVLSLIQD